MVKTRIAVVTGSRADFGLLRPVMHALKDRPQMELAIIVAGSHMVSPALTYRDIKQAFPDINADAVPMQIAGRTGRLEDAAATGTGISRLTRVYERLQPEWVVVLGDRIEAFAAAASASIGGIAVAHLHGGDRAEGVADEAMRHAITKLAHLHLPATDRSARRIIQMGEPADRVKVIGSPAIDGLDAISPIRDAAFAELGSPEVVFLLHPVGRESEREEAAAVGALGALRGRRVLALHPNYDPGRDGILRALRAAGDIRLLPHLPRDTFIALLKRLAASGGVLVGNSSAALIECGALRLPAVNIGSRQSGREHGTNVLHCGESQAEIEGAVARASQVNRAAISHPFGPGRAGPAAAETLAATDPRRPGFLRKRCTY
ncbi:MAG: UDP-N-acetylglucosamine 2-epimerase (hydrolyzing) [Phycisphaerales bacterium]|nr:UDP-N-acetylglucosamine 2-epimerase (hydrolyzing) [Phycisphaerales bacterium]